MSDIVKRLRSVYAAGPTVGSMLDPIPDPLTNEAADEIERLRQQRDEYANEITGKLMPEIERLRQQVTQRGARMQVMREWMAFGLSGPTHNLWTDFTYDRPEALSWFDEDGVPR